MGRDIEDERRTVCKRPDRGGGITRAVPNAGHARATPRAARQAVPAPASTTAAANPQPDSRRAAPLRALSHQLIELGNARHFGVTELCTRTWGETANRLPTSHLRLQRPHMSQQRMPTQLATRTRQHKPIHSDLLTHRTPLVMRLTTASTHPDQSQPTTTPDQQPTSAPTSRPASPNDPGGFGTVLLAASTTTSCGNLRPPASRVALRPVSLFCSTGFGGFTIYLILLRKRLQYNRIRTE